MVDAPQPDGLAVLVDAQAFTDALHRAAWQRRLRPDVLLAVQGFSRTYPAHALILSSQSEFLEKALLTWQGAPGASPAAAGGAAGGGDEELRLPRHELVLAEEVTQRGFEFVLEYLYGSASLTINGTNVFDVLCAAHYLGVGAVVGLCVRYLSQHLAPRNFLACLSWATRTDHGQTSEMLVQACKTLLALRLPRELDAWAAALPFLEPGLLLDVLSSDHLAVSSEYDRFQLVRRVVALLDTAAASLAADRDGADSSSGGGSGSGPSAECEQVGRMLGQALNIGGTSMAHATAHIASQLQLARSCPAALGLADGGSAAAAAASRASSLAAEAAAAGAEAGSSISVCGSMCFPSSSLPAPADGPAALCLPAATAPQQPSLRERLLHEATRFEHFSVEQLMRLQQEGLVEAHVLHAALWARTRLEYQLLQGCGPAGDACGTARPFRFCWQLACRKLQDLQPGGSLRSEAFAYAGSSWEARLCSTDPHHLSFYVCRRLSPPAGHAQAQQQRQPGTAATPALADRKHSSLARCRIAVYQGDNTALQGRVLLGDTGHFEAQFVPNAFLGSQRLVSRADVATLREEACVYMLMSVQVLPGGGSAVAGAGPAAC